MHVTPQKSPTKRTIQQVQQLVWQHNIQQAIPRANELLSQEDHDNNNTTTMIRKA